MTEDHPHGALPERESFVERDEFVSAVAGTLREDDPLAEELRDDEETAEPIDPPDV